MIFLNVNPAFKNIIILIVSYDFYGFMDILWILRLYGYGVDTVQQVIEESIIFAVCKALMEPVDTKQTRVL